MSEAFKSPEVDAEALGLDMVLPGSRELFLDIDSDEDLDRHLSLMQTLTSNGFYPKLVRSTPSKSGVGRHIVLEWFEDLTPEKRIAYQAALGSDRKRELLSLLRIDMETGFPPTVFFEVKKEEKAA